MVLPTALAIVSQVDDLVPPRRRLYSRVIPVGRSCLLHPDVRQVRIVHSDVVFKRGMQCVAGESDVRECRSLVPCPTHRANCPRLIWSASQVCAALPQNTVGGHSTFVDPACRSPSGLYWRSSLSRSLAYSIAESIFSVNCGSSSGQHSMMILFPS